MSRADFFSSLLKSLLEASRVARFAPIDRNFGAIFLREEAIAALQ